MKLTFRLWIFSGRMCSANLPLKFRILSNASEQEMRTFIIAWEAQCSRVSRGLAIIRDSRGLHPPKEDLSHRGYWQQLRPMSLLVSPRKRRHLPLHNTYRLCRHETG